VSREDRSCGKLFHYDRLLPSRSFHSTSPRCCQPRALFRRSRSLFRRSRALFYSAASSANWASVEYMGRGKNWTASVLISAAPSDAQRTSSGVGTSCCSSQYVRGSGSIIGSVLHSHSETLLWLYLKFQL